MSILDPQPAIDNMIDLIEVLKEEHTLLEADMGNSAVGRHPVILYTIGLGPCLAVSLYDKQNKMGVLAHVSTTFGNPLVFQKLPGNQFTHQGQHVVETMLKRLKARGANLDALEAKIVGEDEISGQGHHSNVVKNTLGMHNIPLVREQLGGGAKCLIMYLEDGRMEVAEAGMEESYNI